MAARRNAIMPGSVADIFGSNVFNDAVMRRRLPRATYRALRRTIDKGAELDRSIADVVANVMKDWAIAKGATHFTHWFQPMTGVTAEKHDSFISPTPDGRTMMVFSGKELIKGEPDASSFPSGGLRATFEARGYTAWDCTSPAFVKADGGNITLYIPTVFCAYNGQALDKKTPLLRSMEVLNRQALRILRLFGNTVSARVYTTAGPEQEYFLVDKRFYDRRLDLMTCGRTLFGAPPPKGQELEDHYFGSIKERVASFMNEVNTELWRLGVSAKTQHNEVAPGQYELVPVFTTANVACDHNQLIMEILGKVALRRDMVCLLHEKPFAGVNGSGKHNNWSMCTDDGHNLLDPGETPHDNAQFLVFLCAIIAAVDTYAPLLRSSVASAGNDHRLGANEAPPAIVSIFLGEVLFDVLTQIAAGGRAVGRRAGVLKIGVNSLPALPKDMTDRNRTSPFAFTGNKFEFRMLGAPASPAGPNYVLNTIVADSLGAIADKLDRTRGRDMNAAVQKVLADIVKAHGRVIFNGNNYSAEWVREAEKRGLPIINNTVDAIQAIIAPANEAVFARHAVLTTEELHARHEILLEKYVKDIQIEALTMLTMARREILPAAVRYAGGVAEAAMRIKAAGVNAGVERAMLRELNTLIGALRRDIAGLDRAVARTGRVRNLAARAAAARDLVVKAMAGVRRSADAIEKIVDRSLWPLPVYNEMLFML
ncbi:MAG: glutamine synthetase III [Planctomycetota bacterium]